MSNTNTLLTQTNLTPKKRGRKPKNTILINNIAANTTVLTQSPLINNVIIPTVVHPIPTAPPMTDVIYTTPVMATVINPVITKTPIVVNNINTKIEFEKLLEMKKPDDPLDCLVTLPENKRCDETKIKKDSLLFRPARIVVLGNDLVRNQDLYKSSIDSDWHLGTSLIGTQCWTPDQYTKIEKISITQIAHKLKEEVGDCICKIEFTKEADTTTMSSLIRDGSKLILDSNITDAEKDKMFSKLYERSKKGDIRIMRGYIIRSADLHMEQNDTGMIRFLDADLLAQNKMAERLINVRNIISLTFKLTKYQLK